MKKLLLAAVFGLIGNLPVQAQMQGFFSGSFQSNTNFFVRDEQIGAAGLPHYDNYKVGTEAWLNLNYTNEKWGLEIGSRVDLFYNSIIQNPNVPFTKAGLGIFYIKKKIKTLDITAGYFYHQLGSGIVYRSWEERPLGIDNSLLGAKLEYTIKEKVKLTAFTGLQKNRFELYRSLVSGFNAEGQFSIGKNVLLKPGLSVLNRSMNDEIMSKVVSEIEQLSNLDSSRFFVPKYNTYVIGGYNTLTIGPLSWYVEGAWKSREAIRWTDGSLVNLPGNAFYTSLSYSQKGFGITAQFKRMENWVVRTSPLENPILFQGLLSFIPPISKQNSLRLTGRYFAQSLELRELSWGLEMTYSPKRKLKFNLNGSYIRDFFNQPAIFQRVKSENGINDTVPIRNYFAEGYADMIWKINSMFELELGMQYIRYHSQIYRQAKEGEYDIFTPFAELGIKVNKKFSIRTELQAQFLPDFENPGRVKDYGNWIYGLLEFNIHPGISIAVSDMWNYKPNTNNIEDPIARRSNHYYSVFTSYTWHSLRFTLAYVKQVQGIVCTGGVCRFEPAFSGVKFGANATF